MPTVLQIGSLLPTLEAGLAAHYDVLRLPSGPEAGAFMARHAAAVDAIASSARVPVGAAVIDALPELRIIANFGVGYDNVDVARARARGVVVTNTPDVLTDCVADLAMGLVIDIARGISAGDRFVRAGAWPKGARPFMAKVGGRNMGIVGLGRIGRAIAARATAFGMPIRYHGRKAQADAPYGYEADLAALARWSDFLVIAASGGESTRRLISGDIIGALSPEGYLVNIARGSIVDEGALVDALREQRIAGAALDVFADEPRVPEALLAMDNVVLTPHIASATRETREAMGKLVLENLAAYFETGRALTPV
jgi:lactate dehydrogenase-like 2-hydroxyacid dehydrogenase